MKKLLLCTASLIAFAPLAASAGEAGSFYIKGEVDYSMSKPNFSLTSKANDGAAEVAASDASIKDYPLYDAKKVTPDGKMKFKGWGGRLGFGYYIDEAFRAEISVGYDSTSYRLKDAKIDIAKLKSIYGIVNAYYDINTSSAITPYVGIGVGLGRDEFNINEKFVITNAEGKDLSLKFPKIRKMVFKYSAKIGLGIKLSPGVYLDGGYELTNVGKIKEKDSDKGFDVAVLSSGTAGNTDAKYKAGKAKIEVGSAIKHVFYTGIRFSF